MAAIDATPEKRKKVTSQVAGQASATKGDKPRMYISCHVLVLQLSATSPSRTPPKLYATTTVHLGCSSWRPFVPTLPFAFTWTPTELYLCISESILRTYRIIFPALSPVRPNATEKEPASQAAFNVLVPEESILLPRSARIRSVQFFPPATAGGNATVVIGPRYGKHPAPSIGIYLQEKDLGAWVAADPAMIGRRLCMPEDRWTGEFEDFDELQDCDIIPFDD
ncbi:uncharacterized protein N7482_000336 [Penicillium canariense]|uniref:Uncharacterized protein n=1 Tax=Penicillium canariense TaxID=189055 RepID=A0A9W9IBD2_9EURO|nr:uncharacterized protein N7482_000336 [Penicillium canariense]KAJ5174459.1 hypothetical protein N7482_000336 [Penicillium canariense]